MIKTISEIPRELDKSNIDQAITDYLSLMNQLPLSIQSANALDFLTRIKRQKLNSGPYPSATLFESANRIMTDLIILYGIKELLGGKIEELKFEKYKVEFGNENHNDNDILASNENHMLIGEAFNVAKSFFQTKKAMALKKMRSQKHKRGEILLIYNADAVNNTYVPQLLKDEFHLVVKLEFENKIG